MAGPVADAGSTLQLTAGLVGTVVAGTFLLLIGLRNLSSLSGIVAAYRATRAGAPLDDAVLERHLARRWLGARLLGRVTRRVSAPWQLYPVRLLMDLGFDTATQVALLLLAGGTASLSLPWYTILVLPVLLAAGMTLFDAADGVLMARAYRWAFLAPARKVLYNLTVTLSRSSPRSASAARCSCSWSPSAPTSPPGRSPRSPRWTSSTSDPLLVLLLLLWLVAAVHARRGASAGR